MNKKTVPKTLPLWLRTSQSIGRINTRRKNFLKRRPHRSFIRTRRRDYARSLALPGYIAFTAYVFQTLWAHKKTFGCLILVYVLCSIVFVSVASQDTYLELADAVKTAGTQVELGAMFQAGGIFLGSITNSFGAGNTDSPQGAAQQIFGVLLGLLAWLSTVWLLRNYLAKKPVRLRDALYSSGAPILPTFLLFLLLILQMVPLILAVIAYAAASLSGIFEQPIIMMFFGGAAMLLGVLSLYLATTTLLAMVIITLPNMYPMQALRLAGDLVVGRRIRILLRFIWGLLIILAAWALLLIPLIMFYEILQEHFTFLSRIPLIPFVSTLLGCVSIVWFSSYVYLLYRKVVDDNADPA